MGSFEEPASVTFRQEIHLTDKSYLVNFERAFRMIAGIDSKTPVVYTDLYRESLGRCATGSVLSHKSIILWCYKPEAQLFTSYTGEKPSVSDVLKMLK